MFLDTDCGKQGNRLPQFGQVVPVDIFEEGVILDVICAVSCPESLVRLPERVVTLV